jgi:glycosyltransferase involved in cell wall biosynthesis
MVIERHLKLVVIIPCFNESLAVGPTIKEILNFSPSAKIFVVDNNSSDSTSANAKAEGATVIFEPSRGKGRAFRSALKVIPKDFDAVLMVDGDGTYGISKITEALELIVYSGVDLVVGTRKTDMNAGKTYRQGHKLGNRGFTIMSTLLHSSKIKDSLSGWRLMSHQFIGTFPANSRGFEIETEINAHAQNFDLNVANIEVLYRERLNESFSKLRTYKDGLRILLSNFRIAIQNRPLTFLGVPAFLAQLLAIPLTYRALSGYLRTGFVDQLPSLLVGSSLAVGGSIVLVLSYLLEQMRRMHVSSTRQTYLLGLRNLS